MIVAATALCGWHQRRIYILVLGYGIMIFQAVYIIVDIYIIAAESVNLKPALGISSEAALQPECVYFDVHITLVQHQVRSRRRVSAWR